MYIYTVQHQIYCIYNVHVNKITQNYNNYVVYILYMYIYTQCSKYYITLLFMHA